MVSIVWGNQQIFRALMLRHTADSRSWTARDSRCLARLFRSALGFFWYTASRKYWTKSTMKATNTCKVLKEGVISRPCLTSLKFLKGDFSARDFLNSPKIARTHVGVQSLIGSHYSRAKKYTRMIAYERWGWPWFPIQVFYTLALLWGILQIRMRDNQRRKSINVLWPWRCVAPGSEAPPVEACQFRNVLKLRTGVLGWYFRRCLSVFFSKKTHTNKDQNNKNQRRPVIQQDGHKRPSLNYQLGPVGQLSEGTGTRQMWLTVGSLDSGHWNLTMPWMDMNGIYMYVPYHAISY